MLFRKIDRICEKIFWKLKKRDFKYIDSTAILGENFKANNREYISIGKNFVSGKNVTLAIWKTYHSKKIEYSPNLIIGDDVTITSESYISCMNNIIIGNGVLLGVNTFITDNYHGENTREELDLPPNQRKLFSKGAVKIEDNVWIGRNVCILPNVTIGKGSIVGANSVVTHDIPSYSVAVGAPTRIIRTMENNEEEL